MIINCILELGKECEDVAQKSVEWQVMLNDKLCWTSRWSPSAIKLGNFLTSSDTVSFSRWKPAPWNSLDMLYIWT
jgi:hypothetical protein